jgi:hypothetical protein
VAVIMLSMAIYHEHNCGKITYSPCGTGDNFEVTPNISDVAKIMGRHNNSYFSQFLYPVGSIYRKMPSVFTRKGGWLS